MERQQAFQRVRSSDHYSTSANTRQLKAPCIHVLQVTSTLAQRHDARKELVAALTALLAALQSVTVKPGSLDPKLAEYAFVPISQVLRLSRQVPARALEVSLECISVLLRAGWGGGLEPALSGQLLILFTFLSKSTSAENGIAATSEELQTLALKCTAELFEQASSTNTGKDALTATSSIPALGDAVLAIVDSLTDSKSNPVRLQAAAALKASITAIADDDALASFLPRMVSSLTKVLTPSSSNRPSFRVVEQSLDLLSSLISRLLTDKQTKSLPPTADSDSNSHASKVIRSMSWLQATAAQVKVALANIFKLRNHDKSEVRLALLQLCIQLVQQCRTSLVDCTGMAIEVAVSLAGRKDSQDNVESELRMLLSADPHLSNLLRESLHGWVVSLPRLMQSKDDHARRQLIQQISVTIRLFDQEPTIVVETLAQSLRDSISAVLIDSHGLEELDDQQSANADQAMTLSSSTSLQFQQLKLRLKGQETMMNEFRLLVQEIAKSQSALSVLQELTSMVSTGTLEMRLASFWVSVNLLKDMTNTNSMFDDFIDMGTPNLREELLDDMYSQSVNILSQRESGAEISWHFQALALETVTLQASRYKTEFRPELSEVLYPVLHHLGDSNESLRDHALTCLNILSSECGYADAGELVVANADYIVNAVGLKLAIGDVSPQAPQVLLMMMRLCGPSLLPYLDDLVGSIFDALERYHGYTKLTELLFSVLKGMTEEGVKTPLLAISQAGNEATTANKPLTMADVVQALKRLNDDARKRKDEDSTLSEDSFPHEPWKSDTSKDSDAKDDTPPPPPEDPPPPAPQTFSLLLRITSLTQHYLTSTSPSLRNSLLSLLRTTIPALAKHENSFLPLINTLWPVLLPRLQDPEAYVVSNTLDIVALMCEHAGDFMRGRIEGAWDVFERVYRRTKQRDGASPSLSLGLKGIESGMQSLTVTSSGPSTYRPELYVDAPARMIWNSLVGLFCTIAEYVTVGDERVDEMLRILDPVLGREDVRSAMEKCNADAVWLTLYKKGKARNEAAGSCASRLTAPLGRPEWKFVQV